MVNGIQLSTCFPSDPTQNMSQFYICESRIIWESFIAGGTFMTSNFHSQRSKKVLKNIATMRLSFLLPNKSKTSISDWLAGSLPSASSQRNFKRRNHLTKTNPTSQNASRSIQPSRKRRRICSQWLQFDIARQGKWARSRSYPNSISTYCTISTRGSISTHGSISDNESPSSTCRHVVWFVQNAFRPLYLQSGPFSNVP